jgi:hypothetical protein
MRLLGAVSCLVGGYSIGYAQGLQWIVANFDNAISSTIGLIPDSGAAVRDALMRSMQANVNPGFDTYRAVGIILIVLGLVLVALGDRKPKDSKNRQPFPVVRQNP